MQNETFQLTEPSPRPCRHGRPECECQKPPRHRHIEITGSHDPVTDEWYAGAGKVRGVGESLSMALHDLANKLDALNAYGHGKFRIGDWIRAHTVECRYCSARIFFGKMPSGKWVPLDEKPIDASLARGARLAVFIDVRDGLEVGFTSRPQGRVWIPHSEVCGLTSTVPEHRVMKERWLANRDRTSGQRERSIASLRQLAQDLNEVQDHG